MLEYYTYSWIKVVDIDHYNANRWIYLDLLQLIATVTQNVLEYGNIECIRILRCECSRVW
jgi:hypothetical protein